MLGIIQLLIGIICILACAHIFCNALENLGEKLGISEGATGSIFVAIGTALPETLMPIIALFSANKQEEIGIGAILGAPLMLSTLSISIMGLSVVFMRGLKGTIKPEVTGTKRDLRYFIIGYSLALLLAYSHNFANDHLVNALVVSILFGMYFIYILSTLKSSGSLVEDGHGVNSDQELFFNAYLKLPNSTLFAIIQTIISLLGLVLFCEIFIHGINQVAQLIAISPFILSLIIIPIATELPEKVNSITWIRKKKDTLAISNITGAMTFQGLILPCIGILATPWVLTPDKLIGVILTIIASLWIYAIIKKHGEYKVWHFLINLVLYILNLWFLLG